MSHILVVDDEPAICWGFEQFLGEDGHRVSIAATAEEAIALVREQQPDVIVLDVRLPGMDGLTAIREIRRHVATAPIIVITAHGNLETAVQAVRDGAFDYLPKPFDLDKAAEVIRRALERRDSAARDSAATPEAVPSSLLIGRSPVMQEVFKQIALVAASDVPVLITGESGTGKEMVARAIHAHSRRSDQPFLPVCLAALSPGLVESELFGHAKGAFTGAVHSRAGMLELAGSGTVLLDEIGDTELGLQVKLLRVLEQREITPVGEARPRAVHARIIAATNRDLSERIAAGEFRDDLFFRLSVFRIHLPPLRNRLEDIGPLAEHFLRYSRPNDTAGTLSAEALAELQRRRWPGNVRELRNALEHAAVLARGNVIRPEHLPSEMKTTVTGTSQPADRLSERIAAWACRLLEKSDDTAALNLYEEFLSQCEPALLSAVLEHCGDHKARAAELLGLHRTTLRQKLRKHGLDGDSSE